MSLSTKSGKQFKVSSIKNIREFGQAATCKLHIKNLYSIKDLKKTFPAQAAVGWTLITSCVLVLLLSCSVCCLQ